MTKMNWEAAKWRDHSRNLPSPTTKKALLRAAAAEQPSTFTARFHGTCCHCKIGFVAGTSIGKTKSGYIHALCAVEIRDARRSSRTTVT